eukprot:2177760-Prymnesium_polylepis.1
MTRAIQLPNHPFGTRQVLSEPVLSAADCSPLCRRTDGRRRQRPRAHVRPAGDRKAEARRHRDVRELDALDDAGATALLESAAGCKWWHRSSRALLYAPVLGRARQAGQAGGSRMLGRVIPTRASAGNAMSLPCA